jgi:hypothetical protein
MRLFRRGEKPAPDVDPSRPHPFAGAATGSGDVTASGALMGPAGATMVHGRRPGSPAARCAVPGCGRGVEDEIHAGSDA